MADHRNRWKHRLINILESLFLILAMLTLLALCAYLIWGKDGIWLVLVSFTTFLIVTPWISPIWLMRLYRAQPLNDYDFPFGAVLVRQLSKSAGLPVAPQLYYIPSAGLNAISTGHTHNSAIAVTDGLLKFLNKRELAGVLAHEISHIHNNDIWIMGLANLIGRLTSVMSQIGILLLILNLPFLLAGEIPWLLVALLIFSPLVSTILQLGLSRIREYDADLYAVSLTDDPQGLAQALQKLDYIETGLWRRVFSPGGYSSLPSILRSHPPTKRRIERLLSLQHPPR
jgi:heat shock protein HtpX